MKFLGTRAIAMALVVSAAALNGACIESETHTTIVIEPDGSGRWIVLQRNVHAVADTPDDRLREEQQFLARVQAGEHDQAVAFRSLGATDIKTQLLSSDWPFALQTEARFANLADVMSRFFELLGVEGRATLVREGDRTTFTAVVDPNSEGPDAPREDKGTNGAGAAPSLFGDAGPMVFLRHGQFLSATGFTLSDDGRMAKAQDLDDKDGPVTLSLTWTAIEASANRGK